MKKNIQKYEMINYGFNYDFNVISPGKIMLNG